MSKTGMGRVLRGHSLSCIFSSPHIDFSMHGFLAVDPSALLLEYLGTSGGCQSACKSHRTKDAAKNVYERIVPGHETWLLSLPVLDLFPPTPDWLRLLVVGTFGGIVIGWLLVTLEKAMQKWKQDAKNGDSQKIALTILVPDEKYRGAIIVNYRVMQVAEAITIEFQGLIKFRNSIESFRDKKAFEYYRLNRLCENIELNKKLINSLEIHTDRLKKEWYDLSFQDRKKLKILAFTELEKVLDEYKKEDDILFYIPVIRLREIKEIIKAIASLKFSPKEYLQRLDKLSIEHKEVSLYRRKIWTKLLINIINLTWLDEVSIYYKLINPMEISEFIDNDKDLRNILLETAQMIEKYFDADKINRLTLELAKDPEFCQLDGLIIRVYTEMDIETALDRLTNFKLDIWIDHVGDSLSKVSMDIVHEISVD